MSKFLDLNSFSTNGTMGNKVVQLRADQIVRIDSYVKREASEEKKNMYATGTGFDSSAGAGPKIQAKITGSVVATLANGSEIVIHEEEVHGDSARVVRKQRGEKQIRKNLDAIIISLLAEIEAKA